MMMTTTRPAIIMILLRFVVLCCWLTEYSGVDGLVHEVVEALPVLGRAEGHAAGHVVTLLQRIREPKLQKCMKTTLTASCPQYSLPPRPSFGRIHINKVLPRAN